MKEAEFADSRREFVVTFYNDDETSTISYMMKSYINPLIKSGKLKMTKPDTLKSKNQKYYSDK